jgi:hypothetical protein
MYLHSEAYREGYNAFMGSWMPSDCPYLDGTYEGEEWFNGYDAAAEERAAARGEI